MRLLRPIALATAAAIAVAACTDSTPVTSPTTTAFNPPAVTAVGTPAPPGATVAIALPISESIQAHHAVSPEALDVAALLHTGLTTRDTSGLAQPALAESWITLDQRTWTFTLRAGLTFNDGTPITAQSVVDSWQALATQSNRARNAYLGLVAGFSGWADVLSGEEGRVIGASATSELTVDIQLDEPFPFLAEILAHPAFAPVAPSELAAPDPFAPVGTGPFRIGEPWDPGETLVLSRVWGGGQSGSISTFEINFTSSDEEATAMIESGAVELAMLDAADAPSGTELEILASDSLIYMGFPVTRAPTDEPYIRQALVQAIDRDRIRDQVLGDDSVVNDLYAPPHIPGANVLLCTRCEYDPDLSREIFELEEVEAPENSLSLHVVAGTPAEPWADAIAELWRSELGWPVAVVRYDDLARMIGFLQSGVPDGPFILEWRSEYPAAESWLEPLFDRAGLDDFARFSDRNITRSLQALADLPADSPNRTSHLKEIRDVLTERVPTIPLAVTTRRLAVTDAIVADSLRAGTHLGLDGLLWRP